MQVERVVLNALENKSASLREEKHRVEDNAIHLQLIWRALFCRL